MKQNTAIQSGHLVGLTFLIKERVWLNEISIFVPPGCEGSIVQEGITLNGLPFEEELDQELTAGAVLSVALRNNSGTVVDVEVELDVTPVHSEPYPIETLPPHRFSKEEIVEMVTNHSQRAEIIEALYLSVGIRLSSPPTPALGAEILPPPNAEPKTETKVQSEPPLGTKTQD
jgi:hypothetical protein